MSRRFVPAIRRLLLAGGAVVGAACLIAAMIVLTFDLRLLSFRSGSMEPTIGTGALGVARSVPASQLRAGDVVSVPTASGSRVTHRVVAVEQVGDEAHLELRGDANRVSDAATYRVRAADRLWFAVPGLGYVAAAIASPAGWVLLGGYGAVLLRVLLRRRRDPGPARHRGVPAGAVAALVGVLATGALAGGRTDPTLAAWTDVAGTSGPTLSTATVPAPAAFNCGLVGLFSVSFSWTPVPGATSYTLHYGSGGSATLTTAGTGATITAVIAGGTAWVTANRNFGSSTWTSTPSNTRGYTVAVVSLCG